MPNPLELLRRWRRYVSAHIWATTQTHQATVQSASIGRQALALQAELARYALLASDPRAREDHTLLNSGYQVYSQNDEDGLIAEVFRRIGTTNRRFIEFGVGDGMENNTTCLLLTGWTGAWIEADAGYAAAIRSTFRGFLADSRLRLTQQPVTAETIPGLLDQADVPDEPDLMSIDIDGNDYWVWRAVRRCRPRVVVIEYNAALGPEAELTIRYDAAHTWDYTRAHGASLAALTRLGEEKGYKLVGCNIYGVNAFFVRSDLVGDHFAAPFTARHHFQPPRYRMMPPDGHPRSPKEIGRFVPPS